MRLSRIGELLPSPFSLLLSIIASLLLVLAFPDFEYWYLAWVALAPLLWAIERESISIFKSFVAGWVFGVIFFFGVFWWLTFAPINYAGFPSALAYFLLLIVCMAVAVFPAIFCSILSIGVRKFGRLAFFAAPFIWVFTEFLRYWLTGNNWNAIGYSQAFADGIVDYASIGGIYVVSFILVLNSAMVYGIFSGIIDLLQSAKIKSEVTVSGFEKSAELAAFLVVILAGIAAGFFYPRNGTPNTDREIAAQVIAIQPNVPMSGLTFERWENLRQRHVELAENALRILDNKISGDARPPTTVIFPESPMNFAYGEDEEFRGFVRGFAQENNVSVLFNSAEPNPLDGKYFNSAVMIDPSGREVAQYDKIFLLPFGETVPDFLQGIVPTFVGNFSPGTEEDIFPLAGATTGIMICFESHFGQLSREYARKGADVLIEMTNDGYLGDTPVLRQHLANAIFRAVETNRPLLRVTNVGVTAYISERGEIIDSADSYAEDVRTWRVTKSDGSRTFYVQYGDWFAWLSSFLTFGFVIAVFLNRRLNGKVNKVR